MNLVRLIYASRFSASKFDEKELARINESSQKNNKVSGITGGLVFGEDYFLQCLEGSRAAVNTLFTKISLDTRHESVILLGFEDIIQRDFGEWKMKFVALTKENESY